MGKALPYNLLVKEINKCTTLALKDTLQDLREELQVMINDDFYAQYNPEQYRRQYRIIDACIDELINDSLGVVKIDKNLLDYKDPTDFVLNNIANGVHGSPDIAVTEGRFWEDFVSFANINIPILFRKNLKKYGMNLKGKN